MSVVATLLDTAKRKARLEQQGEGQREELIEQQGEGQREELMEQQGEKLREQPGEELREQQSEGEEHSPAPDCSRDPVTGGLVASQRQRSRKARKRRKKSKREDSEVAQGSEKTSRWRGRGKS